MPIKWNIEWQIFKEFPNYSKVLPPNLEEFEMAKLNPNIIHYASSMKPWNFIDSGIYYKIWWNFALKSSYYIEILNNLNAIFLYLKKANRRKILKHNISHYMITRKKVRKRVYSKIANIFKKNFS